MEKILRFVEKFIPKPIYRFFQPYYHWSLAYAAAIIYRFPSRRLKVIGVTGTNGKSTVIHMLTSILEEVGNKVVSVSSLRLRVGSYETKDLLKRTMPGRFVVQKLLRRGVDEGCTYAVLEITSEGIRQFRHKGINFFMAVLTNVTPEHIESHGSFEKYRAEKAKLFYASKIHILNNEDKNLDFFQKIPATKKILYSKNDLPQGLKLKLLGEFNKENAAAAYAVARELEISEETIKIALEQIEFVPGRMEFVQREPFSVVVDYAHTPDALRKIYQTLRNENPKSDPPAGGRNPKLICVLGATGGGRDKWKRPEMGKIAKEFCNEIILTNEDPYDEDPNQILEEIEEGINSPPQPPSLIVREGGEKRRESSFPGGELITSRKILDRREAIHKALGLAVAGDTVIITGKGAEQWIVGPNGSKISWDDRVVAKEELQKL